MVPDTVEAGESFTVTIGTYGMDSCWEKAATEVEQAAAPQRATIRPFDVDAEQPYLGCRPAVQEFTHTATLSFAQPGAAQVQVHGREMGTNAERTFVRDVIVR